MPNYRRNYSGNLYFFTVVTFGRRKLFGVQRNREVLRESIEATRRDSPWETVAIVLLPDHLHAIWRLPENDSDYAGRVGAIKKRFTRAYLSHGGEDLPVTAGQLRHRRRGVWQPRFWEHTIRDARDFHMHLDYIHINPMKHGLAALPGDWPWSSFHRYVKMGWYEPGWVGRVDLPGSVEYVWPE